MSARHAGEILCRETIIHICETENLCKAAIPTLLSLASQDPFPEPQISMEGCTQFTSFLPPGAFLNSHSYPATLVAFQRRMEPAGVIPAILLIGEEWPLEGGVERGWSKKEPLPNEKPLCSFCALEEISGESGRQTVGPATRVQRCCQFCLWVGFGDDFLSCQRQEIQAWGTLETQVRQETER